MQNLHDRAINLQNVLRENAHAKSSADTVRVNNQRFQAVAQAGNRTAYYVDGIKATKAQQVEAMELALFKQDQPKAEQPVVTDPAELKALPPGTYTVAGKAADKLRDYQYDEIMRQAAKDDDFVAACRLQRSRLAYEELSKKRALHYRCAMLQNFITGRKRAELPMTNFNKALALEAPKGHKARACVVKRLRRLVKIYNRLYK